MLISCREAKARAVNHLTVLVGWIEWSPKAMSSFNNHRHADGQTLVYTASEDKFVLTGGPPSIFDAERGKITGVSLTFFRGDDRVLVEGEASTPVVTQTRVAK